MNNKEIDRKTCTFIVQIFSYLEDRIALETKI